MKVSIIAFCNTELNLWIEYLFFNDWNNLTDMHKFLKPFYDIMMAMQNVFDIINKILLAMDYLFMRFEIEY